MAGIWLQDGNLCQMCTSLHYVSQRHQPSPKTGRSSYTEQLHSTAPVSLLCSIVNTSVRTVKSDTASPAYTRARPTRLRRTCQEPPINQPCVRQWNSRSLSHQSPFLWDQSSHHTRARTHTLTCMYIHVYTYSLQRGALSASCGSERYYKQGSCSKVNDEPSGAVLQKYT